MPPKTIGCFHVASKAAMLVDNLKVLKALSLVHTIGKVDDVSPPGACKRVKSLGNCDNSSKEKSSNDYVLYQAATTVKESLVKEWLILNRADIKFWQDFLLAFVCERKNLQKYVVDKCLQCVAVIIKRGTLDHSSGNSLDQFLGNVSQLYANTDPNMKLLACSMIKAVLHEYSSIGRPSDIQLSFEFHCKCKAQFESLSLQQFFILTMQALQAYALMPSESSPKTQVDILASLLAVTETMLSWEFTPRNPLRAFHSQGNETASLILFKPGVRWKDTLLNGNCLEIFFNLHACLKDSEQLVHCYFLCLTQFASLTGSIFSDDCSTVQYIARLLRGVLQLVQQYSTVRLSGVVACGFANVITRAMTVFPATLLLNLSSELVQAFVHSMSQLTQTFMQMAMRNEDLHSDDTSYMEAFDQILVAWSNLLSSSSSFPKGFFTAPCMQILQLYVTTHISAPEGTRNSQGEQDLEEIVELTDSDLEEFEDQLSSIALLARHVLADVVPFLIQLLDNRISSLLEHLYIVREKGPLAIDSVKTENLFEDLHWILLISGHILSDKVSSEKSLIPDQVMIYSIDDSKNVNVEATVKYLITLGTADSGDAKVDSISKLITSILRVADVERQALSAGLGPTMSPELGGNIVWILTKCCDVYLMPSELDYGQVSVPLITAFGKDTESARWLVSFVLDKVMSNFRGWLSETSVLENTAQLLVTLVGNKSSAHTAISCDVLGELAKDFAENSSYVKELPSLVLRQLSRALVVAGSTIEQEQGRQQYLSQILNPIKVRFDALVQSPSFRKDAQHEAIKDEVERLLECFRGVAMASSARTVSLLFTFLVPVLSDCVPLLDVYRNCSETVEIVLSFLLDVVECQLAYLSKSDSRKIHEVCVRLMEVYSKFTLGKRSGTVLAEEETFLDLLIFMKILTTILNKEYFDISSDVNGQYNSEKESADVALYGLNILLPFITPELLKFPELNDHYFKLITFVCEEHTDKICHIPDHLFRNLIASLEQGLKTCGTDISKLTLEAFSGMALDLFRAQQQKKMVPDRLSAALKSLLKVLFDFVMFEKFEVVDLLVPAADALWSLICCHQVEYAALVQNLLASQTDPAVHQRLVDSFNKLTPANITLTIDKPTRDQFRKNLDSFLADVKGLLCVR